MPYFNPENGELCPVHDTVQRSWEHLVFFEHRTTIHARVPRVTTPSGAVKTVEVPWVRAYRGFTLLMEAYLLAMAKVLPIAEWVTTNLRIRRPQLALGSHPHR
jgi:hypothetical protein